MRITALPILTITPVPPTHTLQNFEQILRIVAQGAFGPRSGFQFTRDENTNRVQFLIEYSSTESSNHLRELTSRLAITLTDTIGSLAKDLGIYVRICGRPNHPALNLNGLAVHHARYVLTKTLALQEHALTIELACATTDFRVRMEMGRSLGSASALPMYLCDSIVSRRHTARGEVVRIRYGKRVMSVSIPRYISANAISDGTLISTAPVVGLVRWRMVQASRCQLNLFSDLNT